MYLSTMHFQPSEVLYTCETLLPDDRILVVSFTLCIFIRFQPLIINISKFPTPGFVIVYFYYVFLVK